MPGEEWIFLLIKYKLISEKPNYVSNSIRIKENEQRTDGAIRLECFDFPAQGQVV